MKKNPIEEIKELGNIINHYLQGRTEKAPIAPAVETVNYIYKSTKEEEKTIEQPLTSFDFHLGGYQNSINKVLNNLERQQFPLRFWNKDGELFNREKTSKEIASYMGWLGSPEEMKEFIPEIEALKSKVKKAGFEQVVLLGMGGSSLAPYVLKNVFGEIANGLPLEVLDSTSPETVEEIAARIPLEHSLFIVSSKSGSTAEVNALFEYFFDKVKEIKGDKAGKSFVAITDPNTSLVKLAKKRNFLHTFINFSDIGGRYSVLSYFGLVPAALIGINITEFLDKTSEMVMECLPNRSVLSNSGFVLGAVMGELANQGRNKLTFVLPDYLKTFGLWLEQLIAESTGKEGKGVLPVIADLMDNPENYGDDRVFVNIYLKDHLDIEVTRDLELLKLNGHPVINIRLDDYYDLGKEFYRWEIATATAGAVLGINPFDQPNVQENKLVTEEILSSVERGEKMQVLVPSVIEDGLTFFSKFKSENGVSLIEEFFSHGRQNDYVSVQAYLPESNEVSELIDDIRFVLNDWLKLAVTVGYGPRFLHSTGQYHKGGPNNGLFLQICSAKHSDVRIPGKNYSFGTLINAQSVGDYQTLLKHNRRVLRVEIDTELHSSLNALKRKIEQAQIEHFMNVNHTE